MRLFNSTSTFLLLLLVSSSVASDNSVKEYNPLLSVHSSTDTFTRETHHFINTYLFNTSKNSNHILQLTFSCPEPSNKYREILVFRHQIDQATGNMKVASSMMIDKVQSRSASGNINEINAIVSLKDRIITQYSSYQKVVEDLSTGGGMIRINGSLEDTYQIMAPRFQDAYKELVNRCS